MVNERYACTTKIRTNNKKNLSKQEKINMEISKIYYFRSEVSFTINGQMYNSKYLTLSDIDAMYVYVQYYTHTC